MTSRESQPGNPMTPWNSSVFHESANVASEMLRVRLCEVKRPLPIPEDEHALPRVLMVRDTVDLLCREVVAIANWVERSANSIEPLTQNTRRKQIVPATPGLLQLKEAALKMHTESLPGVAAPWTLEDASAEDFRPILAEEQLERYMSGRPFLLGVESAQACVERLHLAIGRLESHFGSFHIWIKSPTTAAISSLRRALVNGDLDGEEFLYELLSAEDGGQGYRPTRIEETNCTLETRASVAELLWSKGKRSSQEYETVEDLKWRARLRGRSRYRFRPMQLGGTQVRSLEALERKLKSDKGVRRWDEADGTTELIKALAPQDLDRRYLRLRLVEQVPPREILTELRAQSVTPLSDGDFEALQRRCNRLVRKLRNSLRVMATSTRRAHGDAILQLLASLKNN